MYMSVVDDALYVFKEKFLTLVKPIECAKPICPRYAVGKDLHSLF